MCGSGVSNAVLAPHQLGGGMGRRPASGEGMPPGGGLEAGDGGCRQSLALSRSGRGRDLSLLFWSQKGLAGEDSGVWGPR